jgi:hypothetical protein
MAKTEKELVKAGNVFYTLLAVVIIIIVWASVTTWLALMFTDQIVNYRLTFIIRVLVAWLITWLVGKPVWRYYR